MYNTGMKNVQRKTAFQAEGPVVGKSTDPRPPAPPEHEPDFNQAAARVVGETVARHSEPLPPGIEAAWEAWSRGVGKVDARDMALLRAAFEVGVEAGKSQADDSKE